MKMTQCERIMDYIKQFGSISPMEAFMDLGITRLAARIFDIERMGIKVNRMQETNVNRFGQKTSYTRYSLT